MPTADMQVMEDSFNMSDEGTQLGNGTDKSIDITLLYFDISTICCLLNFLSQNQGLFHFLKCRKNIVQYCQPSSEISFFYFKEK